MLKDNYEVTRKPITTRNPQANAILERIHQTLGNIIQMHEVQDLEIDTSDPWSGILATAMFALRSTYHTALKATPCQVVFSRDAMLHTKFLADWHLIKEHKQKEINENTNQKIKKNSPRIQDRG